ncbi:uncharacterized protein LOC141701926 [Apium graveolens]|uniref:Epidermal patterning factor-like protein n=1 Tax=Apium graveolens TaxID=4045 RepID=A0A6L5B9T6_APIGR|nr:hypothetical protein AG4045_002247 [Apium graveolens]
MEGVRTRFYWYCYLVVIVTLLVNLNSASSRPSLLPQQNAAGSLTRERKAEAETTTTTTTTSKAEEVGAQEVIGSRPPRCEHRCNGCSPCEATQVPTNHHVGIQFTNYEPEGWKCKCGPSFFTP